MLKVGDKLPAGSLQEFIEVEGNGCTIGIAMSGPDEANAWHKAGVEAGGTAIEDAPGVREGGFGKLYLAYLRDPDGNKLCALHRMS